MFNTMTEKQKVIETISSLNRQVLKDFIRLKHQFESKHVNNSEISNTLKTWKITFDITVQNALYGIMSKKSNPQSIFIQPQPNSQHDIAKQLTRLYSTDQQYIESVRCLNSSIDMIKDYIRNKAIKDPTTAIFEKQTSAQLIGIPSNIIMTE